MLGALGQHNEGQRGTLGVPLGCWELQRGHWGLQRERYGGDMGAIDLSHPPGLTLVLHSLFGVSHGPLHESDGLVHVVLYAVDHGSLRSTQGTQREGETLRAPQGAGTHPPGTPGPGTGSSPCSALHARLRIIQQPTLGEKGQGWWGHSDTAPQHVAHGTGRYSPIPRARSSSSVAWGDREGLREGAAPPQGGGHSCVPPGHHGVVGGSMGMCAGVTTPACITACLDTPVQSL